MQMQTQTMSLRLGLYQLQLQTIGEIPLFSLHKIRRVWARKHPAIGDPLSRIFLDFVFSYNEKFKKKTGKDWNCVTLDGMRFSVSDTAEMLEKMIFENSKGLSISEKELLGMKNAQVGLISEWFEENYNMILYSTGSKLPWVFVLYLKGKLSQW